MMKKKFLQGSIKRHPDGFGFFIPDNTEHPDVYIPRHSMTGIMTNDRVMIEAQPEQGGKRFRGEIIKILSRGCKVIVGTYHSGFIKDEGKGWGEDLKIPDVDSLGAKNGQIVSVEITNYPDDNKGFRGKIIEIIGDALDPLTDVKRVLVNNHIPHEFTAHTEKEASTFSEEVAEKDFAGRKDLRHLNLITIDGATAKDFDDAIYVEQNSQGFTLYVAIADVAHYVRVGSAIDMDAYERGTSVYFPNFVVPMLPEVLSNGLCSLKPNVPRLAMVAEMQIDFTGEVVSSSFYEAVIQSKARVTYGEAQEIIDGSPIDRLSHVSADILQANDLAKILMAKRFKDGSLDLDIPEMQMVLDAGGNPVDLIRSERLFAHRLIEEMMLAANVAVAKFLASKDIPAIYRIHESPKEESIKLLEKYLENFGGRTKISGGKLQKKLTRALQEFEGRPEAQVLNILTLRSMTQAKYSVDNVGHFGLGFDCYTHFTSPIRRYPDLIVHRLLKNQAVKNSKDRLVPIDQLTTDANMLSACEQRSVKAERQFQAIKKARFMQKHVGEEFEGVISSVTKFGVFVLLRTFEVDGLIRSENLSHEKLEFDEESLCLIGKRSGFKYAMGDVIKIRVINADPEAGQVDFELATPVRKKTTLPILPTRNEVATEMPYDHRKSGDRRRGNDRRQTERRENRKNSPRAEKFLHENSEKFETNFPKNISAKDLFRKSREVSKRGVVRYKDEETSEHTTHNAHKKTNKGKKTSSGQSFFKKFRKNKKTKNKSGGHQSKRR